LTIFPGLYLFIYNILETVTRYSEYIRGGGRGEGGIFGGFRCNIHGIKHHGKIYQKILKNENFRENIFIKK